MREQMALHTYKQQATVEDAPEQHFRRARDFHQARTEPEKAEMQEQQGNRNVKTAPGVDPSAAWQTFAQRRRSRSRTPRYTPPVPRTLAQTGMRASSGRIKAVRRPLPPQSPVPVRSGRKRLRRGFIWKLLGALTLCVGCVVVASFAFTNNAFRITQVNVVGTHNDALISSIQRMGMQGQNIFLVNVAALKGRIEASPLVAAASLSKQWPNQLIVNVVERRPVLLWQTPRATYSVDSQGVIIAPISDSGSVGQLGTIIDTTSQKATNGSNGQKGQILQPGMQLDRANVAFAVDVFHRLPIVTGTALFKLHYDGTMYASTTDGFGGADSKGSFIVESSAGWQAYLGGAHDANPLDNRLIELQQILNLAQKEQLTLATIDLRYGLRPVYTLK